MLSPDQIQELHHRSREELRALMAHAAGIHAAKDGDGGVLIARTPRRIADRLEGKPRREAA